MFKLTSSPHTHSGALTANVMLWVIIALLPALAAQVFYFGIGVLVQMTLAVITAALLEVMVSKLRHKPPFFFVKDYSGTVTALILAMAIPPYSPYWVILIGTLSAILLGKQAYGGLGQNLFNPAMVGYVVLLISFPVQMTSWITPMSLLPSPLSPKDGLELIFFGHTSLGQTVPQLVSAIDGLTQATPLNTWDLAVKQGDATMQAFNQSPLLQSILPLGEQHWFEAIGWTQVNLCFLAGGLFLLWKGIIRWHIPTAVLVTFFLLCSINWLFTDNATNPLWQLVSGAIFFGAFFIATDPVTAPISPRGRLIFGAVIGLLLYIIRYYGGYPDAVAFAVLLANIGVPLIDHYTRPRVAGHTRR